MPVRRAGQIRLVAVLFSRSIPALPVLPRPSVRPVRAPPFDRSQHRSPFPPSRSNCCAPSRRSPPELPAVSMLSGRTLSLWAICSPGAPATNSGYRHAGLADQALYRSVRSSASSRTLGRRTCLVFGAVVSCTCTQQAATLPGEILMLRTSRGSPRVFWHIGTSPRDTVGRARDTARGSTVTVDVVTLNNFSKPRAVRHP